MTGSAGWTGVDVGSAVGSGVCSTCGGGVEGRDLGIEKPDCEEKRLDCVEKRLD